MKRPASRQLPDYPEYLGPPNQPPFLDVSNGGTGGGFIPPAHPDVQLFTASGTWTKPRGARLVFVLMFGGAGGAGFVVVISY